MRTINVSAFLLDVQHEMSLLNMAVSPEIQVIYI